MSLLAITQITVAIVIAVASAAHRRARHFIEIAWNAVRDRQRTNSYLAKPGSNVVGNKSIRTALINLIPKKLSNYALPFPIFR